MLFRGITAKRKKNKSLTLLVDHIWKEKSRQGKLGKVRGRSPRPALTIKGKNTNPRLDVTPPSSHNKPISIGVFSEGRRGYPPSSVEARLNISSRTIEPMGFEWFSPVLVPLGVPEYFREIHSHDLRIWKASRSREREAASKSCLFRIYVEQNQLY